MTSFVIKLTVFLVTRMYLRSSLNLFYKDVL
jgi:hypothetical protein